MATAPSSFEPDAFIATDTYEVGEQSSLWQDTWRRLRRNKLAMFGLAYIGVLLVVAVVSHFWTPYPTWLQAVGKPYSGPSLAHPFGVDNSGRDIFSRLMEGAQISLEVGFAAAAITSAIGIVLGLIAGYYRGWVDTVISLVINIWYGIPDLLVAMIFVVIVGRGLTNIILAISLTAWVGMARLVRGQTLSLREREFVEAARSVGTRDQWIIFRHIFPNALGPIIVQATYLIPAAILFEAFLSFLGLGVPPPAPSWGAMLSDGFRSLQFAPHIPLIPAVTLSLTLLSLNFLGDGLRDALDPRMKR
jgi:oligopeptide transport system permease protein